MSVRAAVTIDASGFSRHIGVRTEMGERSIAMATEPSTTCTRPTTPG